MADTQAVRFNNIIDLTEGDDDDDQLETLSKAASNAQAAAARLTRQFPTTTSVPTVSQNGTLKRQRPSGNKTFRFKVNGIRKKSRRGTLPRSHSPLPDYDIRSPTTGPRMGTFVPQGPPHDDTRSQSTRSDRPDTSEISRNSIASDAPAAGPPQAAAQYPGRDIAISYDKPKPPEAQREASVLPKHAGRPNPDQCIPKWSPRTSITPSDDGVGKRVEREISNMSHPGLRTSRIHLSPTRAGSNESAPTIERPNSAPQGKRKRSSTSPQLDDAAKSAKWEILPSSIPSEEPESLRNSERTMPNTVLSVTKQTAQEVRNGTGSAGNGQNALFLPGVGNRYPKVNSRQEIVPSSVENGPIHEVFKTIVYPALKSAKKRAHQSLSEDELMSIGKSVGLHYLAVPTT